MDKWKYNPSRRLFLRSLGIVTAGIPIFGSKAYAMLANRMMMGAAGVGPYISNGSIFTDECGAATLGDWTEENRGDGDVTQATFDSEETFKFQAGTNVDNRARAYQDVGDVEITRIVASIDVYHSAIGTLANADYFAFVLYRSDWSLFVSFASDGLWIAGTGTNEVGTNLVTTGAWQEWTFDVDLSSGVANATCDVYLEQVLQASGFDCGNAAGGTNGNTYLQQNDDTTTNLLSYVNWVKVGNNFG